MNKRDWSTMGDDAHFITGDILFMRDPDVHGFLYDYFKNEEAAYRTHHFLRERWPQFNTHTKIMMVNDYRYSVVINPESSVRAYPPVRVIVSGWNKLKYYLFSAYSLKELDDPDKRRLYSRALWAAIFHAPIYWGWRMLGRLVNNKDWYNRGTRLDYDYTKPIEHRANVVTFHLEPLQILTGFSPDSFGWNSTANTVRIACAYWPDKDTLFVKG